MIDISKCHFSKFTEACDDLRQAVQSLNRQRPDGMYQYAIATAFAAETVATSTRFYMPSDVAIIKGKEIDAAVIDVMNLPYPTIAILNKQKAIGHSGEERIIDRITIAQELTETFKQSLREMASSMFKVVPTGPADPLASGVKGFVIYSVVKELKDQPWLLHPVIGIVTFGSKDGRGYAIRPQSMVAASKWESTHSHLAREVSDDTTDVINLCVLLSLHNVRAIDVNAPDSLNRKRFRSGRTPLYSYKILEVHGDRWDSERAPSDGEDYTFRSHMRRGHIRRLDDTRRVWVRATFVHGARPGFVDKDYSVNVSSS